MIFEFIIVYQDEGGVRIREILLERLHKVLTDNLNEFDDAAAARMLMLDFERSSEPVTDDMGATRTRTVLGFSLELPDETESVRIVLDEFVGALVDAPIDHVVKFDDPLLRQELVQRAEELFALEMKLRRVLTVIYLHACPDGDPFNLLRDESVQPMAKEKLQPQQMKAAAENQFFHLTFGQYVGLNNRPQLKDLATLIRSKEAYEAFRRELMRQPVEHEDDAVFLVSLRERMNAIEDMRNCVAHNRRPSHRVAEDYRNALPLVNQALDNYLGALAANWLDSLNAGEMSWDTAAREVVESALENAKWDEKTRTITFHDLDNDRMNDDVVSREQLEDYLRSAASDAFYAYCPRDDGEYIAECDEYGIVENALADYEDRLETFFAKGKEDEPEF